MFQLKELDNGNTTVEAVIGATIMADEEIKEICEMDNFTLEDRKELIKQSVLLEQFHREIHDLKVSVRESLVKIDQEKLDKAALSLETIREQDNRLNKVERANDQLAERLKSIMWIGGFIITLIQVIAELSIHIFSK